MRLVHYGHSCVFVETSSARLLIDPGSFATGFAELTGLDAVLITHQHPDHMDTDRLPGLLAGNPQAEVVADAESAEQLAGAGLSHRVVEPGERLHLGDTAVDVLGGEHATIHPDIPIVANNAYLIDETLLHPGDAFTPPPGHVEALLLPTAAPWLKGSDAVDYLRAVAPSVAMPIHQGLLSRPEVYYQLFHRLAPAGTTVHIAEPGEPLEL